MFDINITFINTFSPPCCAMHVNLILMCCVYCYLCPNKFREFDFMYARSEAFMAVKFDKIFLDYQPSIFQLTNVSGNNTVPIIRI